MRGDLSVGDYLDRMNAIGDNLALSGRPVDDDELIQIIMNNLGPAYEIIVSAVQARDTPITHDTLKALLLFLCQRMDLRLLLLLVDMVIIEDMGMVLHRPLVVLITMRPLVQL
ncbi:unnamed protein product [Prunus armeniaca]